MSWNPLLLKDAERIARVTMILTLLTAGVSKLCSKGAFFTYYSGLFRTPALRIHLPPALVDTYLHAIPAIELALAILLLSNRCKRRAVYAWCAYFLTLEFGHYVLEQWSPVNEMIPFIILGMICLVLPYHRSWFRRDLAGDSSANQS